MATNLHALIRYRALDTCFRERRRNKTWQELAAACGDALREYQRSDIKDPSRRTIFADIEVMKNGKLGYSAPIAFTSQAGYHYEHPEFSIEREQISKEQRNWLGEALFTLKQFTWSTQLQGLDEIIARLEHGVLGQADPYRQVLLMDIPSKFSGLKWLDPLLLAARRALRVRLVYKPFTVPEAFGTEVSPYLLKEYNGRWFLVGFDHTNARIQNYGLDRIEDVSMLEVPAVDCPVNLRDHYRQVIGVTVHPDRQMERVVFKAIPEQSHYIANKPIHPTQRVLHGDEQGTTFAIDVIPNFELESLLLSFGERIDILEPESLRRRIAERHRLAANRYEGSAERGVAGE